MCGMAATANLLIRPGDGGKVAPERVLPCRRRGLSTHVLWRGVLRVLLQKHGKQGD